MAGGAVKVTAPMTRSVFESHFQFAATHASASIEADTALMDLGSFSFVGFASMGFETGVSEKVPTPIVASLRGFQTARVGVKEIGTFFLETATTFDLDPATMLPLVVVRFETVAAHITASEETRERGDHVIMSFLVEQGELFVGAGGPKLVMWKARSASTKRIWYSMREGALLKWVNSSYPQGPNGTWASRCSCIACSFCKFLPFLIDSHWGWRSTLALAVTRARAQHKSSAF